MSELWVAVVTALGVIFGTIVGGSITVRVASAQRKHEEALADLARQRDLELRRGAFQADTLTQLQMGLQRYARALAAIHFADVDQASASGKPYGQRRIDLHWDREELAVGTAILLLSSRVDNDRARSSAIEVHRLGKKLARAATPEEGLKMLSAVVVAVETAINLLGEQIRHLPPPMNAPVPMISSAIGEANWITDAG